MCIFIYRLKKEYIFFDSNVKETCYLSMCFYLDNYTEVDSKTIPHMNSKLRIIFLSLCLLPIISVEGFGVWSYKN